MPIWDRSVSRSPPRSRRPPPRRNNSRLRSRSLRARGQRFSRSPIRSPSPRRSGRSRDQYIDVSRDRHRDGCRGGDSHRDGGRVADSNRDNGRDAYRDGGRDSFRDGVRDAYVDVGRDTNREGGRTAYRDSGRRSDDYRDGCRSSDAYRDGGQVGDAYRDGGRSDDAYRDGVRGGDVYHSGGRSDSNRDSNRQDRYQGSHLDGHRRQGHIDVSDGRNGSRDVASRDRDGSVQSGRNGHHDSGGRENNERVCGSRDTNADDFRLGTDGVLELSDPEEGVTTKVIEGDPKKTGDRTWLAEVFVPRPGSGNFPANRPGGTICVRGPLHLNIKGAVEDARSFARAHVRGGYKELQKLRTEMRSRVWK
eukprot:TRINITY_DN9619_c0_g2_i1.p1 TRINITY_DN9619_c0_g2~~TRINITY_DN9619_c0_g2_i1.p1  ORF type:complete len:363 (-),score=45.94 TRINITY_DN9619_c0_g2_i1:60-1148(-)